MNDLKTYQKKWAYEKYWVMAHSQQHYNALRQLFKGNDWSDDKAVLFERYILECEAIVPTTKTLRTAYQHVWGYFKKIATKEEKAQFCSLEFNLENESQQMQKFLEFMTLKYQPSYLLGCHLMDKGLQ